MGIITICEHIYFLKDILIASQFGNENELTINIHVQVLCGHKFLPG